MTTIKVSKIPLSQDNYPVWLRKIYDPPEQLWVQGDIGAWGAPCLAIVGSRRATSLGLSLAYRFAFEAAQQGWTIVSGLAYGIDAAAHKGALAAGGRTIGVIGCGLDVIYPRAHAKLYQTIIEKAGLLVSEYPMGEPPKASHFPQRNRIISGLSQVVWVIEAALKSGSLITARYALEQGREVFVCPGSLDNPQSAGCHRLIQQGATLVTSVSDMIAYTPPYLLKALANYSIRGGSKEKKTSNIPIHFAEEELR